MAVDTVEDMIRVGKKAGLSSVDRAIGFYLANFVKDEDKFLEEIYKLELDTEEAGALTLEAAEQKYFKKVIAKR